MRNAVVAVRFRKESSTVIAQQTGIPARTIRRYVQISKDPVRARDSPFYMTHDPSGDISNEKYPVSFTFANQTAIEKNPSAQDEQKQTYDVAMTDFQNPMDPSEEVVLSQLDTLCDTDEMSIVFE